MLLSSYHAFNCCSMVRHLCPFVCHWSIFWLKAWGELVKSDCHYLWKTYAVLQGIQHPVRVNPIPRQIPPTPKYLRPWVCVCEELIISLYSEYICRLQPCSAASFHLVRCFVFRKCASPLIVEIGAAFVELYFVMSSLFASRAYYAFGFLALTAGVVGLTTATVTILFTYFVLCAEEYRRVSSGI
jgi:hypothetical protein